MNGAPGGAPSGGVPNMEAAARQQQQMQEQEEQKRVILKAILSHEASERLANIRVVKPDKARQIEAALLQMYQTGRLSGKVSEDMLKQMLDQFNQSSKQSKVTIARRKGFDSDEEEEDDSKW
mmetsp:Transcript_2836/g.4963  ORF Transcript_2836/g.4963 Transcript_2836/m.4963 type:complete len:122 (-) Transcript_2836:655-1020(-)|eukprot:CAMPEP_0184698894 /NCGR_PEP_ID=MMETSP0313-20130426/5349_1 /TAXON_ID=2792 /ORGANISM="Porphyridium aerugineum, Strain SAG 1380-2" /LENGTH=121 /DNA_ID=CAMNT_0027157895 /DNA_START=41 /DNA_END=406 /DNA_ORIENTATION=-